jgi:hypothetical protein
MFFPRMTCPCDLVVTLICCVIAFVRFHCDITFVWFRCDITLMRFHYNIAFVRFCCNAAFFVISPSCDFVVILPSCDLVVSLCVFRVPLFLSDVFCASPFALSGCLFFHRRYFAWFAFSGCLFFHRRSFAWALCIFGVPLFSSEVFYVSPFAFLGAYFFIKGLLYEPMTEGS